MKIQGISLVLVLFFVQVGQLSAQWNKQSDTLLVIAVCTPVSSDTTALRYIPQGKEISWWDLGGNLFHGKVRRITNEYLLIDTAMVFYDDITRISTVLPDKKGEMSKLAAQMASANSLKLKGNYSVMTRAAFEKLKRVRAFKKQMNENAGKASQSPRPFANNDRMREMATNRFLEEEKKLEWKSAMKDTTRRLFDSVHQGRRYYTREYSEKRKSRRYLEVQKPHSITVSLLEPIANELTLTYGYRISHLVGIEFSPGIYFETPQKIGKLVPDITYVDYAGGMNYYRWKNGGYQMNITGKIYFPTKPNRYIALKTFGRYFFYDHKIIPVAVLYRDSPRVMAEQSEKSSVLGGALIYGWQLTLFKCLHFDFYAGLGAYKRWSSITVFSGGLAYPSLAAIEYPFTYTTSAWFPSFQVGVRTGLRFGSRKIK
jgi:hypothetical protein